VLARLWDRWLLDSEHTHGLLVVPAALWLLWIRRRYLPPARSGSWNGLVLLVLASAVRVAGKALYLEPLEQFSIIPALAGVIWFLGGWRVMLWSAPVLVFLALAIPLPYFLAVNQARVLQRITATGSAFLLQTAGVPAWAEDHIIQTDRETLDVAYGCSGLQMMMSFAAVTFAAALMVRANVVERTAIFLAAVPIAVIGNIIRVAATGYAYQYAYGRQVRDFFHDAGGVAVMIPLSIVMLFGCMAVYNACFPRREVAE
jgi:exosortase